MSSCGNLQQVRSQAEKLGMIVVYDPSGIRNRCFYQCLAKFLKKELKELTHQLECYMLDNESIPTMNENNVIEEISLYEFLTDVDFPSHGNKRPETWHDAVLALRDEMVPHPVILAASTLYRVQINIVDWLGRVDRTNPLSHHIRSRVYLGYTGNHYVLLQTTNSDSETENLIKDAQTQSPRPNKEDEDSDCVLLSSPGPKKAQAKRVKRKGPPVMEWWEDQETDCQPGISLFKGRKLEPIAQHKKKKCQEFTITSSSDEEVDGEKSKVNLKKDVIDLTSPSPVKNKRRLTKSVVVNKTVPRKMEIFDSDSDEDLLRPIFSSNRKSKSEPVSHVKNDSEMPTSKQRKISVASWDNVEKEVVQRLPLGIDGLKIYEIENYCTENNELLKDGRKWKKACPSQWKDHSRVRFADCKGSFVCTKDRCPYKVQYGVVNKTQFEKKNGGQISCKGCGAEAKEVHCSARRYLSYGRNKVTVYHIGEHSCPVIPIHNDKCAKTIEELVRKNPNIKPSEVQSAFVLSAFRSQMSWEEIEKEAASSINRKRISNIKEKVKNDIEPFGHNFEAVVSFKEYADKKDSLYIYKVNDKRGNPDMPSFIFKASRTKMKIALDMDQDGDHFMNSEFCFFDGKHRRCKGFVTLTASVYHPLLRKQVPLAIMEAENEDSSNVELFWTLFNEALRKVANDDPNRKFNPIGWCSDMAGANLAGIARVFGKYKLIKGCEFHFKDHRNKKARQLDSNSAEEFKYLCDRLLYSTTVAGYESAKADMDKFISADESRAFLATWVSWWHDRRGFIFRAFTTRDTPQMNQAEVIHAGWVHRDRTNLSLLDACQADTRDALLIDVELKNYQAGTATGGKGPSFTERERRKHVGQLAKAKSMGQEMFGNNGDSCGLVVDPKSSYKPKEPRRRKGTTKPQHATPSSTYSIPTTSYAIPSSSFSIPSTSSAIPSSSYSIPSTAHAIPSSPYSIPSTSHAIPSSSYSIPSTSHAIPSSPYSIPSTAHAIPSSSYSIPSTSHAIPSSPYSIPSTSYAIPNSFNYWQQSTGVAQTTLQQQIPPLGAAQSWNASLSPHSYEIVVTPARVQKCYGCGCEFAAKYKRHPSNLLVKHIDRRVRGKNKDTQELIYSHDFTNTYYHPEASHITRKNPLFTGLVYITKDAYSKLDEAQRSYLDSLKLNVIMR